VLNAFGLVRALQTRGRQDLRDAEITRDIAEIPEVWTDRYKLLQIIVNFIANAGDAMAGNESGGRRIAIRARCVHDQPKMTVEDSGVGIPAVNFPGGSQART
jgi:C4-dicarboxylate-specific signal transduction histidine kinase